MAAYADARPAIQPLPRLSVALLAAAAAHVLIGFGTLQATNGYLDVSASRIVFELRDAMPFVLAAAIVAGWDRWPAGRTWLVAAVAAFAIAGTLGAAARLWFALTWPPVAPEASGAAVKADLLPVVAAMTVPLGPLLASIGLWRSTSRTRWGNARRAVLATTATIMTVILVVRLLVAVELLRLQASLLVYEPFPGSYLLASLVYTVGGAMVALIGVAAVRAAPRRYLVPEVMIAVGALAAAIAAITAELGPIAAAQNVLDFEWIGWAGYVELLGLLAVALGFLTGRISVPGER